MLIRISSKITTRWKEFMLYSGVLVSRNCDMEGNIFIIKVTKNIVQEVILRQVTAVKIHTPLLL